MEEPRLTYRLLAGIAERLLPLGKPFSDKLARGDRERRAAPARWAAWGRDGRDPARPLLWIHAASVGEGLQALAVIEAVKVRHPDWQVATTFFSPSAESLIPHHPADRIDYLPYDTAANAATMLAALRPSALVFSKLDLWPGYAIRANASGVPVGMVAGTVSPVSGRRHPVARWLAAPGYRTLDRIGAIAEADAAGLIDFGARADRVAVTGDPRFDSAWARAAAVPADWPHRRLTSGAPTLVAGSTWPADEAVLLDAFAQVRLGRPDCRLILVPHEPSPRHVSALESEAALIGLEAIPLSRVGGTVPDLIIVDQLGLLAGLYRGATLSYVGGGFGRHGLHSVLEPAACGVPVFFGPRWRSSREAGLLIEAGSSVVVKDPATLAAAWTATLSGDGARIMGDRARGVVRAGLGASARNAGLIEDLIANR